MDPCDDPDFRPGGPESLAALHYRVVAAEEFDLAEEAHHEHQNALWHDDRDFVSHEDVADTAADTKESEVALTIAQMIGMLRHYLGAETLNDDVVDRQENPDEEGQPLDG